MFWSGAGISVDPPTCGPRGPEVTERAIELGFAPGTLQEIQKAYEAIGLGVDRYPRLEAVLEVAARAHGVGFLEMVLDGLARATPNPAHHFFARHLHGGGHHSTANFDLMIEACGLGMSPFHFHGRLDGTADQFARLGARLTLLERGFESESRRALSKMLFSNVSALVIVGYSGSDYFDVDPFFRDNAEALATAGLQLFWLDHDNSVNTGPVLEQTVRLEPPMFVDLKQSGVPVHWIRGRTVDALKSFARMWELPWVDPLPTPTYPARSHVLDLQARVEASRQLYAHMGMWNSHDRLVAGSPRLRATLSPSITAEIAWQRGQYARAQEIWESSLGAEQGTRAAWLERKAACLWVRGSYVRAYTTARRAVLTARDSNNREVLGRALETTARIVVHAGRTPDLFWFATSNKRRMLLRQIASVLSDRNIGLHLREGLRDVERLLSYDPERFGSLAREINTEDASEKFSQYESLSAMVDYRRGQQRRSVASGQISMTASWLNEYVRAAQFLGMSAGVATVVTLPGAAPYFGLRAGLRNLWTADFTIWHRVRLSSRFIVRKLKASMH